MIDIKIDGLDRIEAKADDILYEIKKLTQVSLIEAASLLRNSSIEYLKGAVQGNPRSQGWGRSMTGDSITSEDSWGIYTIGKNKVTLQCFSQHAAIVELGGIKTGVAMVENATGDKHFNFPIGMQENWTDIKVRPRFAIQQGYGYLTNSMNSPEVQELMLLEMKKTLSLVFD
jgi:hypothetical protein